MANVITSNYSYYASPNQVKSGEFWYDDGSKNTVTMDSFLKLMTAQLANQDFNNAVDDSQFIQQLASYAQVEAMNKMTQYSQMTFGSNLVGRDVTILDTVTNETVFGTVEALNYSNGKVKVFVNGGTYDINQVCQVYSSNDSAQVDYDKMIQTLLKGIEEINSEGNSSLTGAFTSSLQELISQIQDLINIEASEKENSTDTDFIVDETVKEDIVEEEVVENVDTATQAAQENASELQSETSTME